VGPRAGLDAVETAQISAMPGIEPRRPDTELDRDIKKTE
jgi:hypothetical protein